MNREAFTKILERDNRDYRNRASIVQHVLTYPELIEVLLLRMGTIHDKNSTFSARILELTCKKNLMVILPYLAIFCRLLPQLKFDGAIRACVKIIELLSIEYFIKSNPIYIEHLSRTHLDQFAENCFDCMIADRAIAIQAHSMYSLYLIGTQFDWIHPELKELIVKKLPHTDSAGYRNRGKKIIAAISKPSGKVLKLY